MNIITVAEANTLLPTWQYFDNHIEKHFVFVDFDAAFVFMTAVAAQCAAADHHPEWTNVYNKLTIKLSTHDHHGVTEKDIKLANKIDKLFELGVLSFELGIRSFEF